MSPPEDLQVPRVREDDFHSRILPYRKRTSLELSEAIRALYAVRVSTWKISTFSERIYRVFYSPQSISRSRSPKNKCKPSGKGPYAGYYAFLDGTYLSIRLG